MNSSQKIGLFILVAISIVYIYFSFFSKDFKLTDFFQKEETEYNPVEQGETQEERVQEQGKSPKNVKIYVVDKKGEIRSVNRTCDPNVENSCFSYAIKELIKAPSKWEKSNGFSSEIPQGTRILSVRETPERIMIDLSGEFESGGGTESTYYRVKQLIKTSKANASVPVFLYINGKQANVISGEGIMIKQPLSERSLDE